MKYDEANLDAKKAFLKQIMDAESIVITSHKNPDDDSIASVLLAYEFITTNFPLKDTKIIYTGEPVDNFNIFKHYEHIKFSSDIANMRSSPDLLITLDGNQLNRFSNQPDSLSQKIKNSICIDHHPNPPDKFTFSLIDLNLSSTTEILYKLLFQGEKLSKPTAELILLGILGDTGNFSWLKPDQGNTLLVVKDLIKVLNTNIEDFQSKYRTISTRVFSLIQEYIKNTSFHTIKGWPQFQVSFITQNFIASDKYTLNETSLANHIYMHHYLRVINGNAWGIVITPTEPNTFRVSMRSLPNSVSVRSIMQEMEIGGGHDRAAGGTVRDTKTARECLKKILDWMKKNNPEII